MVYWFAWWYIYKITITLNQLQETFVRDNVLKQNSDGSRLLLVGDVVIKYVRESSVIILYRIGFQSQSSYLVEILNEENDIN